MCDLEPRALDLLLCVLYASWLLLVASSAAPALVSPEVVLFLLLRLFMYRTLIGLTPLVCSSALFLSPLAVWIKVGHNSKHFWINILLFILFVIPGTLLPL